MKLSSLRLLLSTGALAAALLFAGCGGGGHKATPVSFSQTTLQAATDGTSYSQTLTVTGGTAPYTWTVSSGSLPAGMTLSSSGVLSGTPTVSGTFTFSITVTDSSKPVQSLTASYTLTVAAPPILITAPTLPAGTVGVAYSQTLVATGGTAPYTWTLASGALPGGLTLSSAGVLSGTPTTAGSYTFAFTVTDAGTPVETATTGTLTLTIAPAPLTGTALLQGTYFFKYDLFAENAPNEVDHEVYVGSLILDGAGNITAGVADFSDDDYDVMGGPVTGSYTIGSDGRGTLTLNLAETQVFTLAVGGSTPGSVATRARFVETDAATDYELNGTDYATGFLQLEDPTAFTNTSLIGSDVFGWSGDTYTYDSQNSLPQQGGLALVGQIIVGSDLNLAAGSTTDIATNQTTDTNVALAGSVAEDTSGSGIGSSSMFQSFGRALLNLTTTTYTNGQLPAQSVIYVIDANTSYVISSPFNAFEPLYSGYLIRQQSGSFSAASLSGSAIGHGASTAVNGQAAYAATDAFTLYGTSEAFVSRYSADGAGNLTTVTDANIAGSITSAATNSLTYTVASNGRTTFGGSASPILWLSGTNSGFALTQPPAAQPLLLTLDPQVSATYSTASLNGGFMLGTQNQASYLSTLFSGEVQADGAGNLNGTVDFFTDNGPQDFGTNALALKGTAAVDSTGRATIAIGYSFGGTTVGSENVVLYMVSPTKAVGIDVSTTNLSPAEITVEPGAAPAPPPVCNSVRGVRQGGIHPDC